jgi:predicted  nucleic acid-binding Zn-ribbon protein
MAATDIEKKSLEAHVDLCAERYKNLDEKLENLETRIDKIETHVIEIKERVSGSGVESYKTIITIGTTVFGVLLSAVLGLLVHMSGKL